VSAADKAASALIDSWTRLMAVHPDAWIEIREGVSACATGIPFAGLNGVWCWRRDPDPADVEHLLDELSARGLPHLLQLRPDSTEPALAVPERRGLTPDEDVPLMRLDDPAALDRAVAAVPALTVRELEADEAKLHARVAGAGFEMDPEHFERLLPRPVLAMEGVRTYAGELDGEIVTTAIGVTHEDYIGIFNVATPPAHRGRGYGAAITARAVADGLAAGADWAWLQSSPSGYRIYEALGFRTLERWLCWVRV
jgi:ribosomal protein S18 acetylase RimI-like enzyme